MKRTHIRGVRIIRELEEPPVARPFTLDHYDARDNHIAQLGAYADLDAAREAFAAAVRHRPQRYLCLRQGTRVIASHEPGKR